MKWDKHYGYNRMLQKDKLTIGLNMPIENHGKQKPTMNHQVKRAQLAEELGFTALWFQDVLLEDPTFDDPATGQIFDSHIYLTYIGSHTSKINLGTAASVLSLRHPVRLAKEAASIENLFPERFMLGLSSGDRRRDFSALNIPILERGEIFRESLAYFKKVMNSEYEDYISSLGSLENVTLVPKPTSDIPIFITGYAQQTFDYVAAHGDGFMFYPQSLDKQESLIREYQTKARTYHPEQYKPFFQPIVMDLHENPDHEPEKIKLGYRVGRKALIEWLKQHEEIGVNHVMISLAHSTRDAEEVMKELGEEVVPHFPPHHS